MARYVWFNRKRLESATPKEPAEGLHFVVEISPYDVPKGVSGSYDRKRGEFAIEFLYIDHEPPGKPTTHDKLSILSGRHSGRLQKIVIPIDHDKASAHVGMIALQTKVLDALRRRRADRQQAEDWNQDLAEKILQGDEFKEITEDIELSSSR